MLAWAEQGAARLLELDGDDERIDELTAERDALRAELGGLAQALTDARTEAAERFAAAVTAELASLAMPHARVSFEIRQTDDPEGVEVGGRTVAYGPAGVDEVELLLAPHPGAPPRPIAKGASGGELSRVMLAVEVVFAGTDPVPTYLFDEVDAGVGGKAAVEIGRRLAKLAKTAQVVVVTHLPQVAAFADRQLLVEKTNDGSVTRSGVKVLEGEDRVRELSRMLAGPGGLGDGSGTRGGAAGDGPGGRVAVRGGVRLAGSRSRRPVPRGPGAYDALRRARPCGLPARHDPFARSAAVARVPPRTGRRAVRGAAAPCGLGDARAHRRPRSPCWPPVRAARTTMSRGG